ncbi:MAG: hypothetical protein JWM11_213, partial [Planctomycetaceae bacterium]|nr:hypothetical protein [Planctomycetaceae bacterium]
EIRGELNAFELHVEDFGDRADQQGLRQPRHTLEQAISDGQDGRQNLLDDTILTDDDLMQLFGHQIPTTFELRQKILETRLLFSGQDGLSQVR